MGITAISHKVGDGRHIWTAEPDMSVVTKHRSLQQLKVPHRDDCLRVCASFPLETSHDGNPTDVPCLGVLFIDDYDPNCVIFVEHTAPPQPGPAQLENDAPKPESTNASASILYPAIEWLTSFIIPSLTIMSLPLGPVVFSQFHIPVVHYLIALRLGLIAPEPGPEPLDPQSMRKLYVAYLVPCLLFVHISFYAVFGAWIVVSLIGVGMVEVRRRARGAGGEVEEEAKGEWVDVGAWDGDGKYEMDDVVALEGKEVVVIK